MDMTHLLSTTVSYESITQNTLLYPDVPSSWNDALGITVFRGMQFIIWSEILFHTANSDPSCGSVTAIARFWIHTRDRGVSRLTALQHDLAQTAVTFKGQAPISCGLTYFLCADLLTVPVIYALIYLAFTLDQNCSGIKSLHLFLGYAYIHVHNFIYVYTRFNVLNSIWLTNQ